MKKIIGILLAGALVTSAFAADVSAKVKVDGSLFNLDKDGNVSALKVEHKSEGWNPDLSLSINGDRAGASMSFYYGGDPATINSKCEEAGCWNNGKDNGWCGHGGKPVLFWISAIVRYLTSFFYGTAALYCFSNYRISTPKGASIALIAVKNYSGICFCRSAIENLQYCSIWLFFCVCAGNVADNRKM